MRCGGRKKSPRHHLSVVIFSGPSGSKTSIRVVLRVPLKPVLLAWEMLHYSLSLMNRLDKTGSAIFVLYFGLVALEGSSFHKNFLCCCLVVSALLRYVYDVLELLSRFQSWYDTLLTPMYCCLVFAVASIRLWRPSIVASFSVLLRYVNDVLILLSRFQRCFDTLMMSYFCCLVFGVASMRLWRPSILASLSVLLRHAYDVLELLSRFRRCFGTFVRFEYICIVFSIASIR